jgi:hypothetical protein
MDLKKNLTGSLLGAGFGVIAGALFGPSAGITAMAEVSRRWINRK